MIARIIALLVLLPAIAAAQVLELPNGLALTLPRGAAAQAEYPARPDFARAWTLIADLVAQNT